MGRAAHFVTSFFKKKKQNVPPPVAIHSMLLALEPRMVFDASVAVAAGAADHHDTQATPGTDTAGSSAPDAVKDASSDAGKSTTPSHAQEASNDSTLTTDSADTQSAAKEQAEPQTGSMAAHGMLRGSGSGGPVLLGAGWSEPSQIDFSADPSKFTLNEGGTKAFGAGSIVLSDPDSTEFTVTIQVQHGTLSLDYVPGVTGNQYTWNADRTEVSFEADLATVQSVLNTLKYTGDTYYNGSDTLKITVDDGTNHSQEFAQQLTIEAVPNKPLFPGLPSDAGVTKPLEDTNAQLKFNYGTANNPVWGDLHISDPDSNDTGFHDTYDLTLTVTNGSLFASSGSWDIGSGARAGNSTTYTLSGMSIDEVNGILANLHFLGDQDFNGRAQLTVAVKDLAPALVDNTLSKTFDIDVLPVNDSPVLHPADQTDTAHQLRVDELVQDASGKYVKPAESIFDLSHFNINYDPVNDPRSQMSVDGTIPLFDVDNNLSQLVVKIDVAPAQGSLWRKIGSDWVKLGVGSTFSLQDVKDGSVKYVHDQSIQVRDSVTPGSEHDSFKYTVNDGAGGSDSGTMHIVIEPINQPPKVVVQANAVIPSDRLDGYWANDPVSGASVFLYTIWAYEGQQGIPFSFNVVDPDQAPGADYTIQFTELPDLRHGAFWYSADGGASYHKVAVNESLSLAAIQQGFLRFNHSGLEQGAGGGNFTFKISVTDDGGGEGPAGAKTIEATMGLNIRANNDNPEWSPAVSGSWVTGEYTTRIDGVRDAPLSQSFLDLTDNDSSRQSLTYTVTSVGGDSGHLLYYVGLDGSSNPIYRYINVGDKITQKDIDAGKIFWRADSTCKCNTLKVE